MAHFATLAVFGRVVIGPPRQGSMGRLPSMGSEAIKGGEGTERGEPAYTEEGRKGGGVRGEE